MKAKIPASIPLAVALLMGTASAASAQQSISDIEALLSRPVENAAAVSDKKGEVTKVHLRTQAGTESVSSATSLRNCFEQVRDGAIASKSKTVGICRGPKTYTPDAIVGQFTCVPDAVKPNAVKKAICRADATM